MSREVDKECIPLVSLFNSKGLITEYSCCGHGKESFIIVFHNDTKDEKMENFLTQYSTTYNTTPFIGKFFKWCRKINGKLVYSWMYEVGSVKQAKLDFAYLNNKREVEYK